MCRLMAGVRVVRATGLFRQCGLLVPHRTNSTVAAVEEDWVGSRPYEEIPGPKPLPLIGNLWRFFPLIGDVHSLDMKELQSKYYNTYGKIFKLTGIPGRKDFVFVLSPEDAQKVFRNEGRWPIREGAESFGYYRSVLRKDLHQELEGTITSQGEPWHSFRTKVNQPMMQPRSAKLYVAPIDQVASEFIDRIQSLKNSNSEVPEDFINHLYKWSLESIATVALDARLGCLAPDLPANSEPQQMINAVEVILDSIYKLDLRPSPWKYISTPQWRKFVKAMDIFTDVSNKYVQQAVNRIQSTKTDSGRELSILERLLLNNDNPMVACIMAMDMMFGGIDTTSHATASLLFQLAKNPEKQQNLFEDLKKVIPSSKNSTITSETLNEMKYLKACLKESMRLQPIVIGNVRELPKDLVLSNYQVPKGTVVFMCNMLMGHMDEHFPEPGSFIPERWLKGSDQLSKAHPYVYMPFGFGPRMCVGRRFAELEIHTLTAKIIRKFRVEYNTSDSLKYQSRAIATIVSPLNFKMVERE